MFFVCNRNIAFLCLSGQKTQKSVQLNMLLFKIFKAQDFGGNIYCLTIFIQCPLSRYLKYVYNKYVSALTKILFVFEYSRCTEHSFLNYFSYVLDNLLQISILYNKATHMTIFHPLRCCKHLFITRKYKNNKKNPLVA